MKKQEQELALSEIIWRILFGWKMILAFAVVFALLSIAHLILKSSDDLSVNINVSQEKISELAGYREVVTSGDEYLRDSILMRINPYEKNVLTLKYYVDSGYTFNYTEDNKKDYTSAIITAYYNYSYSENMINAVMTELGIDVDVKYLEELIEYNTDSDAQIFAITLMYPDVQKLNDAAEVIDKEVQTHAEELAKSLGEFDLVLVANNISVVVDTNLAANQQNTRKTINDYKSSLTELESEYSTAELKYINSVLNEESKDDNSENYSISYMEYVKRFVIGAFIGVILAVVIITVKVILTRKVRSSRELARSYELPVFGIITAMQSSNPIDRLIVKLKKGKRKVMSEKECIMLAISNIELICKKENINSIFITGTKIEELQDNIDMIITELKERGINASGGNNICYDAASLFKMSEIGNVIIVEQTGVSDYLDIENQIRNIGEHKVNIMGMIGIDAIYN